MVSLMKIVGIQRNQAISKIADLVSPYRCEGVSGLRQSAESHASRSSGIQRCSTSYEH